MFGWLLKYILSESSWLNHTVQQTNPDTDLWYTMLNTQKYWDFVPCHIDSSIYQTNIIWLWLLRTYQIYFCVLFPKYLGGNYLRIRILNIGILNNIVNKSLFSILQSSESLKNDNQPTKSNNLSLKSQQRDNLQTCNYSAKIVLVIITQQSLTPS